MVGDDQTQKRGSIFIETCLNLPDSDQNDHVTGRVFDFNDTVTETVLQLWPLRPLASYNGHPPSGTQ